MIRKTAILSLIFISFLSFGNDTLRLVYYDSFPPYSYKNSYGQMEGILVDIAKEVLEKEMGLVVSHQGFPWGRAQRMVFNGQADAFISLPTPARLEHVDAAEVPVFIGPITLFTYKDHPRQHQLEAVSDIEDLKDFKILDYVGNGWGDSKFPEGSYTRLLQSDLSTSLSMLAKRRGDVVATDQVVAEYLLAIHDKRNLVMELPVTIDTVSFLLCISKKSSFRSITKEFSKHMSKFRAQKREKNILAKYK